MTMPPWRTACRYRPRCRAARLGAGADRHQAQPRRRRRHAQGQGVGILRVAGRRADQGQGRARSIRTASSTRTRRMEALQLGSVQILRHQVRAARRQGIPDLDSTSSTATPTSQDHRRPGRQEPDAKLDAGGISGLAFWDNGFKSFSSNCKMQPGGLQGPEDAHPVLQGARRPDQGARRDPAGDGVLRGLPGAADRRRRRHREPALEPLFAEDERGAEARHHHRPRLRRLRGGGQQEVLGRSPRRHPGAAHPGDGRRYQIHQRQRVQGQRGRARQGARDRQDRDPDAVEGRPRGLEARLVKVHKEMESRVGTEIIQAVYKETGFDPAKV